MKNCNLCKIQFSDGVQCGTCKKHFDFGCANITEAGYRKLGPERRAAWKCSACRNPSQAVASQASPVSPVQGLVTLEMIHAELCGVKTKLNSLSLLHQEVINIREELSLLRESVTQNIEKVSECDARLIEIESKLPVIERTQSSVECLESAMRKMQGKIDALEQRARLNNVEIKGVPVRKNENLFTIVENISQRLGVSFSRADINHVTRVPTFGSADKLIILNFHNRYTKEDFVAAARALKFLNAQDIGFTVSNRIFVNDHLTRDTKQLLTKVKTWAKNKNFKYIWVKFCKIHVRRSDSSPVIIVHTEADLNKLT